MSPEPAEELLFISHQGRSRAPVSAEERRRTNSALQRRTWQKKVLASAEKLRTPTGPLALARKSLCASCQLMVQPEAISKDSPPNAGPRDARSGTCNYCGIRLRRNRSPPLQTALDTNLDPFTTFAVKMTPDMQELLCFVLTYFGPKFRNMTDPDSVQSHEVAKSTIHHKTVLFALLAEGQLFSNNSTAPSYTTLVSTSKARTDNAKLVKYRSGCYNEISQTIPALGASNAHDLVTPTVMAILILGATAMMEASFSEARLHVAGLARIFAEEELRKQCPSHLYRDSVALDCLVSTILKQVPLIIEVPLPPGPSDAYKACQTREPVYRFGSYVSIVEDLGKEAANAWSLSCSLSSWHEACRVGKLSYDSIDSPLFKCFTWSIYRWALRELYDEQKPKLSAFNEAVCHTLLLWHQWDLARTSPFIQMLTGRQRAAISQIQLEEDITIPAIRDLFICMLFLGCEGTLADTEPRRFYITQLVITLGPMLTIPWESLRNLVERYMFLMSERRKSFEIIFKEVQLQAAAKQAIGSSKI